MARPLRIEFPGAVYHVTSRGNEKKAVFRTTQDRQRFLDILQQVNKRYNWICHGYCLMTNHYHLILETPEGNLSSGMRQLNGVYTQYFNTAHTRKGHLLQGRYKAFLIQKEGYLLAVCRYVVLNPVRARIVSKPEDYPWSSYLPTAGLSKPHLCLHTAWLLSQFGQRRGKSEKEYREFVAAGSGRKTIWTSLHGQTFLGESEFIDTILQRFRNSEQSLDIPRTLRYRNRPPLNDLFTSKVCKEPGRRRDAIVRAVEEHGYLQREIAEHLGLHYSTISRILKVPG